MTDSDDDMLRIAIPAPSGNGSHVVAIPVEEIVEEGHPESSEATVVVGDCGAVVTAEQCFRLSDQFNRAGEVIERYHNE